MLKFILVSIGVGAGAAFALSLLLYFITRKKSKDAFVMPTIIICFLALVGYVIYGFIEEGFWEGLLVLILSAIPAGAAAFFGIGMVTAITSDDQEEETSEAETAQERPERTPDKRYFRVTKEDTIKNMQYECERTNQLFKKSKYISSDYHNGADEIMVHFKHYVDEFSRWSDEVRFHHDESDDSIVMILDKNIGGKQYRLKFTSLGWWRDANDDQHRICSFTEDGYELAYRLKSNDHGSVWEYTDNEKVITASYDRGVSVKSK